MSNQDFKEAMAAHGVKAARAFPPMEDWCRLSVGLPDEMAVRYELKRVFPSVSESAQQRIRTEKC